MKPSNRISSRAADWYIKCEKWAVARESFQVLNVHKVTQDLFFQFICLRYEFAMKMEGAIAIFEMR
jgi:hypothetical protein